VGRAIAVAGANAIAGGEMLMAAGEVIGKRMALGAAALTDPANADHDEFALMVPEKARAFSAAGSILMARSMRAAGYASSVAVAEMALAAKAGASMAACASPAALAAAQGELAWSWFGRSMSFALAMGTMAMQAQGAAMRPVRVAAMANARRLRRS
jgi:hypothetical protein